MLTLICVWLEEKALSLPTDKCNDVKINNYTTLEGQVMRYKRWDQEFDLPLKVLEMNKNKDYGRYDDNEGSLHVNFLTDNVVSPKETQIADTKW